MSWSPCFPLDVVAQNELVLIFQHAYRHPQLRHHACLALANPTRVLLMDREDLLTVRNHFPLDQSALYLAYLPLGMPQIARYLLVRNPAPL